MFIIYPNLGMSFIESGIRKFTFFEKQPVLDPAEKGKKFDAFKVCYLFALFIHILFLGF
jgi:hypothetical protein